MSPRAEKATLHAEHIFINRMPVDCADGITSVKAGFGLGTLDERLVMIWALIY